VKILFADVRETTDAHEAAGWLRFWIKIDIPLSGNAWAKNPCEIHFPTVPGMSQEP